MVPVLLKRLLEIESFFKQMRSLAVAASFASSVEVIQQHRLIFRVSNLINDDRSFFFRSQATEVSNAAFGNDNVNVEGCMVDMAAERNNGADFAAFCQGVGEEYGEVTVTAKSPEPPTPFINLVPQI